MPGPLAVITDAGNVFGANVKVGPDSGAIDPVFQFTGEKIGFNVQARRPGSLSWRRCSL